METGSYRRFKTREREKRKEKGERGRDDMGKVRTGRSQANRKAPSLPAVL